MKSFESYAMISLFITGEVLHSFSQLLCFNDHDTVTPTIVEKYAGGAAIKVAL